MEDRLRMKEQVAISKAFL